MNRRVKYDISIYENPEVLPHKANFTFYKDLKANIFLNLSFIIDGYFTQDIANDTLEITF